MPKNDKTEPNWNGKWCTYCRADTHTDAECWCTRPADWHPGRYVPIDAGWLRKDAVGAKPQCCGEWDSLAGKCVDCPHEPASAERPALTPLSPENSASRMPLPPEVLAGALQDKIETAPERQRVAVASSVAPQEPSAWRFDLEEYIAGLRWSEHATEHEKALVVGNLRGMFAVIREKHNAYVMAARDVAAGFDELDRLVTAMERDGHIRIERDKVVVTTSSVSAPEECLGKPARYWYDAFQIAEGLRADAERRVSELKAVASASAPSEERAEILMSLHRLLEAWGNNQLYFEARAVVFRAWRFLARADRGRQ